MSMNIVDRITTEQGNNYVICKDSRGYWAISANHVVDNALTNEYNGISGCLSETADECIKRRKCLDRTLELKSKGYSDYDIVMLLLSENLL